MKSTFYFFIIILFAACASPEKDYEGMASDLCQCMTPLAELHKQVLAADAQKDTTALQRIAAQFEQLSQEGEDCAAGLEEKYGDFAGEEEEKAKAAIRKKCPGIAEMMEQGAE